MRSGLFYSPVLLLAAAIIYNSAGSSQSSIFVRADNDALGTLLGIGGITIAGLAIASAVNDNQPREEVVLIGPSNQLTIPPNHAAYWLKGQIFQAKRSSMRPALYWWVIGLPLMVTGAVLVPVISSIKYGTTTVPAILASLGLAFGAVIPGIALTAVGVRKAAKRQYIIVNGFIKTYTPEPIPVPQQVLKNTSIGELLVALETTYAQQQIVVSEAMRDLGSRESMAHILGVEMAPRTPLAFSFPDLFQQFNYTYAVNTQSLRDMWIKITAAMVHEKDSDTLKMLTGFGFGLATALTVLGPLEVAISQYKYDTTGGRLSVDSGNSLPSLKVDNSSSLKPQPQPQMQKASRDVPLPALVATAA